MEFMDLGELMRKLMGAEPSGNKKLFCTANAEEKARFAEICSRRQALQQDIKRAQSRLQADANRMWADIMDKHNGHGKNLHFDGEEGVIYEITNS